MLRVGMLGRLLVGAIALSPVLLACGAESEVAVETEVVPPQGAAPPASAAQAAPEAAAGSPGTPGTSLPPPCAGTLRSCTGELTLLAGAGARDANVNAWVDGAEGGPAVDAELSRPHMAMMTDAGEIFIVDKDAHAVRKVDTAGLITTVAGVNAPGDDGDAPGPGAERHLYSPNGLWASADGWVYILDLGNKKLRKLSPAGELTTMGKIDSLSVGRGLVRDEANNRFFVSSGSQLLQWTEETGATIYSSGFTALGNLAMDPQTGDVLATDRGAGRLYRIAADGSKEVLAGGGRETTTPVLATEALLPGVRAVAPDGSGGYFLGLHEGSAVKYLDSSGSLHDLLGAQDVSEVRALVMTPSGDLLITEHDAGFVKLLPIHW